MRFLYESFARMGADRAIWQWAARRLRILCYHGVCDDRLAGSRWLPAFFVTRSQFEAQLRYLHEHARVLPLAEATRLLRDGALPPRAVALTFDDGYANNLALAYPLLKKYGLPATIFVSSGYTESGALYPFLKTKLLALCDPGLAGRIPEYKTSPLDTVVEALDRIGRDACLELTPDQDRTLRPLTIEELARFDSQLVEIGSHTHTHTILANETRERRSHEIRHSIARLTEWLGRPVRAFSYPNGQTGNFDAEDAAVLRSEAIDIAVTGLPGANGRRSDSLALRRYPVGIYHDDAGFRAEVTGFRSAIRQLSRSFGL